jgi:hypothetical protein
MAVQLLESIDSDDFNESYANATTPKVVDPTPAGTTSPGPWQRQQRPERPQRQDNGNVAGKYRTLRGQIPLDTNEVDEKEAEKANMAEKVKYLKGTQNNRLFFDESSRTYHICARRDVAEQGRPDEGVRLLCR